MIKPRLLDLFCGRGGWTKAFMRAGWDCVGVDVVDLCYPGRLYKCSVFELESSFIDSFDGVVSSPPCEDFARAWLPWLRGDQLPDASALRLLWWSVELCWARSNRLTECSIFAARHVPASVRCESYAFWGDVPLLMPQLPRKKTRSSGLRPDLRAEIPASLSDWIALNYSKKIGLYECKN
jgi:hypothetical protein